VIFTHVYRKERQMGGSGGSFKWPTRDEIKQAANAAESAATNAEFGTALGGKFNELLAEYNDRDTALISKRLSHIESQLASETDGYFELQFGGSVAKRTYVDGLSDIDTLLIVNEARLRTRRPEKVKEKIAEILQDRLAGVANVVAGRMAVTLTYADGMEIQVLPALRTADGVKVQSSRVPTRWSHIDPEAFQKALTRRNQQCGNKLVPTIKLAKAINANLPEEVRLTGYHIESLAISAFRGYVGELTTTKMLPTFFERASELVRSPIKDKSGQSVHVDDYLGIENSAKRVRLSQVLSRIHRRMRNATAGESLDEWDQILK
jgi:hypothetical protein